MQAFVSMHSILLALTGVVHGHRQLQSDYWTITSGSEYCELSPDGKCVSDGAGNYGTNEACTATAQVDMTLTVKNWNVMAFYNQPLITFEDASGNVIFTPTYVKNPNKGGVLIITTTILAICRERRFLQVKI